MPGFIMLSGSILFQRLCHVHNSLVPRALTHVALAGLVWSATPPITALGRSLFAGGKLRNATNVPLWDPQSPGAPLASVLVTESAESACGYYPVRRHRYTLIL